MSVLMIPGAMAIVLMSRMFLLRALMHVGGIIPRKRKVDMSNMYESKHPGDGRVVAVLRGYRRRRTTKPGATVESQHST